MKSNKRTLAALAFLAAGTALSACSAQPEHQEAAFIEQKALKIEWRLDQLPVAFPVGSEMPAPGELAQLDRNLQTFVHNGSTRIFIEADPASTGRQLASRRYATLERHLVSRGFAVEPVTPGVLGEANASGPAAASVYVGHYAAVTPSCPDWRKPTAADYTNTQSSNFGCSTTANFAQMLYNPGDVLQGQRMGPADGARAAIAIRNYRDGKKAGEQQNGSTTATAGGVTTSGGSQ